jgi:hypothetical protein
MASGLVVLVCVPFVSGAEPDGKQRARAASFTPDVGFFSSKEEARRVVHALQ